MKAPIPAKSARRRPGCLLQSLSPNSTGVSVVVGANGIYQINFTSPTWVFLGNLAQALTNRTINSGTDNIGGYSEITFNYSSAVPHAAGIRLYNNSPVVTFNDTTLATGANDLAFPHLTNYPMNLNHISFIDTFSVYSFTKLYESWAPCDNLLLFFNTNHDAFIISAATNYTISTMLTNGDASISCGINSGISQLPSGFTHRFILVAQNGINRIYTTWGNALLALGGKTPPANDAVVELEKLGYWTDNGAAYYPYWNGTAPGIANTLLAVKDEYASKGFESATCSWTVGGIRRDPIRSGMRPITGSPFTNRIRICLPTAWLHSSNNSACR